MSNYIMLSYHIKSIIDKYTPISLKKLGTYTITVKQEKDSPEKIQSFLHHIETTIQLLQKSPRKVRHQHPSEMPRYLSCVIFYVSLLLARLVIQLRGMDLVTRQGSRHVKDNACIYASTMEFSLKFQQVVNQVGQFLS